MTLTEVKLIWLMCADQFFMNFNRCIYIQIKSSKLKDDRATFKTSKCETFYDPGNLENKGQGQIYDIQ